MSIIGGYIFLSWFPISTFLTVKGKSLMTPGKDGKEDFILGGRGAATMGFCSTGERSDSTPNTTRTSGDLEPKSGLKHQGKGGGILAKSNGQDYC